MSAGFDTEPQGPRLSRSRRGRVLGGVCSGLDDVRGIGTLRWRAAFVFAALCGGLGAVAYLACWLVIPEGDESPDVDSVRGIVLLAWAVGGLVAVVLTAGVSAAATVFGLGWLIVALAGIVFLLELSPLSQRVPGCVALTAIGALALPAVAVAVSPMRLDLQDGSIVSRPASVGAIEQSTFTSGFGTQLIDLRASRLPSSGTVTMHVDAGLRRTLVALPSNQCVHVTVNYAIHPFASQLATLVSGRVAPPFDGVVLFGNVFGEIPGHHAGTAVSKGTASGPTLDIDFSSQGGSLYVRDYPATVSPDSDPNWPGYHVTLEPRPELSGETHKVQKMMLRDYHQRLVREIASQALVNRLFPGPCKP